MKNNIIDNVIRIFNNVLPKKKNRIIFTSQSDFSDNSKAFFEYMKNSNYQYDLIWIVNDKSIIGKLTNKDVKVVYKNTIQGIFFFCSSKYIFTTHCQLLRLKSKKQIYINLFHGMPLKTLGQLKLGSDEFTKDEIKKYKKIDYTISTSSIMRYTMSSIFTTSVEKTIVAGQPRNDYLFKSNGKQIISEDILEENLSKYSKIILYMPTFRVGFGRKESNLNLCNILNLHEYLEADLNEYLKINNYILLVKIHPFEESKFRSENYSNIKVLNSKIFNEKNITTNEILNGADILITDYSSVYFDYLLLSRPIIFVNTDEKEYIKNRGFIFDNPNFWRPGPKVKYLKDLTQEIDKFIDDKVYYQKERNTIKSLVHTYEDGKSCKRIFEHIFKIREQ